MSEKEMNSYRFVSGEEPSEEMLAQIMSEAAEEAKIRNQQATATYFAEMRRQSEIIKSQWSARIKTLING